MKNIDVDYVQRLIDSFNSKYNFILSFEEDHKNIILKLNGQHIYCCSCLQEVNACYRTIYRMIDNFI